MAERMRSLAKKSGSKMGIAKGSMNHIGTTPYKYRVDVFVSYVDVIKTAGEVCVTWERRGKTESTQSVKVKDNKAVFKETLTMETTLFRKNTAASKASAPPVNGEELKFDEKIAKFALRKGGADGKAVGKMHVNLADHIKGTAGTVFADLKLSNGSIVVTKIESTLLQTGKRSKNGGGGSEGGSETTDMDGGMENDSIFGDDAEDPGDLDLMIDEAGAGGGGGAAASPPPAPALKSSPKASAETPKAAPPRSKGEAAPPAPPALSTAPAAPVTSAPSGGSTDSGEGADGGGTPKAGKRDKVKNESGLAESPSLRDKLKSKLRKDKAPSPKKERVGGDTERGGASKKESPPKPAAETGELRAALAALTAENKKLKTSKQAMMEEIEELRSELEASEQALEEAAGSAPQSGKDGGNAESKLRQEKRDLAAKVKDLEAQNSSLLDELDGQSEGSKPAPRAIDTTDYKRQIVDLELALKREPQYLDVVDELKVTKMALALANMEKEQALFALKQALPQSPVSSGSETPSGGWGLNLFG